MGTLKEFPTLVFSLKLKDQNFSLDTLFLGLTLILTGLTVKQFGHTSMVGYQCYVDWIW